MALNVDDFEAALRYYQEALHLSQAIGNRQSVIVGLYNLGETAELLQQNTVAADYYRQGLREAAAIHSVSLITAFLTGIARMQMHSGNHTAAAEMFGLLLEHPSMISEVKEQLKPTIEQLRAEMGEAAYTLAAGRGASLDLGAMVARAATAPLSAAAPSGGTRPQSPG